jgi:hypothetical protein
MDTAILGALELSAGPGAFAQRWPARETFFDGPGGWSGSQWFGMSVGDCVLDVGSGANGQITTEEVAAIRALQRAGATIAYQDWMGNDCTVRIVDFAPSHMIAGLWNYTLTLRVRTAIALLGELE